MVGKRNFITLFYPGSNHTVVPWTDKGFLQYFVFTSLIFPGLDIRVDGD